MPLIHDKSVLLWVVCLVFYLLPAARYVFLMLKWKKVRERMPRPSRRDNVEAWWDLVMGQENRSPGGEAQDASSLGREKQRWFLIMLLSWIAGTVVLINVV